MDGMEDLPGYRLKLPDDTLPPDVTEFRKDEKNAEICPYIGQLELERVLEKYLKHKGNESTGGMEWHGLRLTTHRVSCRLRSCPTYSPA
jgi:hypothetical protein